jgi:hypothetical protein
MLDEDQNAPAIAEGENTPPAGNEPLPEAGNEPSAEAAQKTPPEPEAPVAPEPEPDDKGKTPVWVQKRIDDLVRARHDEARRAAALEAELAKLRRGDEGAEELAATRRDEAPQTPEAVRAAAVELRAVEKFNESCNAIADQGEAKYSDFQDAMRTFQLLGGLNRPLIEAASDAGNAHLTLYHLGKNPEEASRIMALPERQQAVALARLSDKLAAPPPPAALSKAPPPISPVSGNGNRNDLGDPDKLSTAEWMRRRDAGEIK